MTDGQILVRAAEITKKSIESMTEDEILLRAKEITTRRQENEARQAEANRKKIEGQKKFYEEKEKRDLFLQKHVLAILKCIIRIWCKTSQTVMVTDVHRRLMRMLKSIHELQAKSDDYLSKYFQTKYFKLF